MSIMLGKRLDSAQDREEVEPQAPITSAPDSIPKLAVPVAAALAGRRHQKQYTRRAAEAAMPGNPGAAQ